MKQLGTLVLLILFAFTVLTKTATVHETEDAVIVEDDDPEDIQNDDSVTTPPVGPEGGVIVVEVVPGECKKFRECYPALYFQDESITAPIVKNDGLRDFILSSSSPCEPLDIPKNSSASSGGKGERAEKERDAESKDNQFIWCPTQNHRFKPQKQQLNTTEESVTIVDNSNSISNGTNVPCGPDRRKETLAKVVGGREAEPGEFPWMVVFTNARTGRQFCGGSLLDESHVLTAAHCFQHLAMSRNKNKHLANVRAWMGEHDILNKTETVHQKRNITRLILHKGFSMKTIQHDVAIVRLAQPITFAENVAPICLTNGDIVYDDGNTTADVAGWGQVGERRPLSPKLRTANIRVWTQQECKQKYYGKAPGGIAAGMVCAGSSEPITRDACKGDSGGSLTLVRNGRAEQIGLVSWGIGCGAYPGVYTRIDMYQNWINKYKQLY